MSAESPRRGVHKGAQVVSPQPIVDRSIIDSVAGIINDIVPQGYAGVSNSDNKETISWARFEYADINDPALYPDYNEGSSTPPLLLVLGYATGVQVWLIAATGEATEVLSWRQGVIRTLRILPNPKTDDEHVDPFEAKRPMVAICDSAGPGPQFCHISFVSLKTSEQVKSIKFKNPVCDVLANKRSVVVTFLEKIAVFDARTLEDVITITTCYASPGPNPNPVALGTRWLAYSEKKLLPARRSSGGCEGEGVPSYTATVLYAAKSLGKGLRGLGETVASSLTGNSVSPMSVNSTGNDVTQPGVVTILDLQAAKEEKELDDANIETVIAHFTAHSDAIVAMTFDLTGALLMTADRRGHDFHVFKIQPHPGGPTLAAVHHLYILHRGDTTAKVQDMVFSSDTRWAAISTVRGTTHVFPVAPYGGLVGVRTHSTPHVVNRLSRFHKSAGLTDDGTRSHSPVSHAELPMSVYPYSNPRLPPYPLPTILHPLSQIRQPSSLNHANCSSQPNRPQQRQRLHSDDSGTLPLKICVCFAPPRAWMYAQRESSSKTVKRAVDSLFIMACHGNLIQYDLEPKPAAGVPKEKVCDDTMIELEVEAKGQWPLLRTPISSEIVPPLPLSNPLLSVTFAPKNSQELDTAEDRWLSQVEIVTHAGPHRRLWMGPQFVFKTYNAPSGVSVNLVEAEAVEIGVMSGGSRPARSKPVNMPHAPSRPLMPVVIDGSGSSYEQSPRFMEAYGDPLDCENVVVGSCESQLREDLAEAMLEITIASHRAPGRRSVFERVGQPVTKVVNPLGTVITVSADEEDTVVSNSGQELFDSAEEIFAPPEAPRSVCAEEGPASLGDLEPPECGQTLRDLTEICAEMRSASEPAIDSVPDENIRELKERRALCAEMRTAATGSGSDVSSIDFEREEAFRDVPTSLSLCAEQGEIPNSPMTRAKETVWCCKKSSSGKRDDHEEARERNFAKAKYVVNYDDDSVTLMENKTTTMATTTSERNTADETRADVEQQATVGRGALKKTARREKVVEPEKSSSKKSGSANASLNTDLAAKRPVEQPSRIEKYVVKEDEDSIIIEDARRGELTSAFTRKQDRFDERVDCDDRVERTKNLDVETTREKSSAIWRRNRSKIGVMLQEPCSGKDGTSCEPRKNVHAKEESSLSCESQKENAKASFPEAEAGLRLLSDDDDDEFPSLDPPPLDDFSSIEYHMVAEAGDCPAGKDTATSSTQSDDDIEHIHIDSEMMQLRERACGDATSGSSRGQELSPLAQQRKNSKSTISDDDLEYIHSSELGDAPERVDVKSSRKLDGTGNDACLRTTGRRHSRHALSSDDDLEHVQHSEIRELERASLVSQKTLTTIAATVERSSTRQETSLMKQQAAKSSKSSKKRKDIMVIDSEAAEAAAEVTVIYNPLEEVCDINCATEHRDKSEATFSVSPTRKTKSSRGNWKTRSSSSSSSSSLPGKRAPSQLTAGAVEIIDIDAIEKVEKMSTVAAADVPKYKILPSSLPKAIVSGTRPKKSRKSKKWHADGQLTQDVDSFHSSKVKMAELQEAVEEVADSKLREPKTQDVASAEISWSSIVKKNAWLLADETELMLRAKELQDLEPLMEVEEKSPDNGGSELALDFAKRATSRGCRNVRRTFAPKKEAEEEEEEDKEGERIEMKLDKEKQLVLTEEMSAYVDMNKIDLIAVKPISDFDSLIENQLYDDGYEEVIVCTYPPRKAKNVATTVRMTEVKVREEEEEEEQVLAEETIAKVDMNEMDLIDVKPILDVDPLVENQLHDDDGYGKDMVRINPPRRAKNTTARTTEGSPLFSAKVVATDPSIGQQLSDDDDGNEVTYTHQPRRGKHVSTTAKTTKDSSLIPGKVETDVDPLIGHRLCDDDGDDDDDYGKDMVRINPPRRAKNTTARTTEDSGLVSAEVVTDRRLCHQRLVDVYDGGDGHGHDDDDDGGDAEIRRGNAAVRGESQESSLQLAAARRRRRQVEKSCESVEEWHLSEEIDQSEFEKICIRGKVVDCYSIWADYPKPYFVTSRDSDEENDGLDDNNGCTQQEPAASSSSNNNNNNNNGIFWTTTHSMNVHRKVCNGRSKKKKRR